MTHQIRHRGPDDTGQYVSGSVALAACRLSIIDVAGGHQPVSNEDDSCWVAYNGEIYNFPELRDTLLSRGHQFRTKCDTEVVVHAYEEYGLDFATRFNGMFAFALWDANNRRLILARDRIGIKPLYYTRVGDTIVFASEIKAILQYPGVERRVDPLALDNIMTFEYNPSAQTIFSGIHKLPAGHLLVVEEDGRSRLQRYWDLEPRPAEVRDLGEAVERLRFELARAVTRHLMSEVPLGVFLSGGLDSSAIVAMMARAEAGPVKTFSIGFSGGEGYDELSHARTVAHHFGTDHYEFVLEPKSVDILPDLVWHLEEPIADEAALPLYFLSSMAKEHVKVVLAGDGGDEIFSGYGRYYWYHAVNRYGRVPRPVREWLVEPIISALPHVSGNGRIATLARRARRLMEVAAQPEELRFSTWNRIFSEEDKRALYSADFRHASSTASPFDYHGRLFAASGFVDPMSRAQYVDVKSYLVDCLLLKSDKVTSAFSLECRVPLLDAALVEYVASLPAAYKYHRGRSKHVLREAMRGILPRSIVERGKQGFILPFGKWFNTDLRKFAREILLDRQSIQRGYFDPAGLERTLDTMTSDDDRHARRLYALVMFELWNRAFMDGGAAPHRSAFA